MNSAALSLFLLLITVAAPLDAAASPSDYLLYVSNERSNDVTVIDGKSDQLLATIQIGKRPRGIHCSPDGARVFVALSGSPRMAPGVETERPPADKAADGIGVIDTKTRTVSAHWHVGSDPEQFALSSDGRAAFIANEDDATASMIDLTSGEQRGTVSVSAEPEGVGVNPINNEVYVTCEEKGEVYVIDPAQMRVLTKLPIGGRPRSVAFSSDGKRAYVPSETEAHITVIDAIAHKVLNHIALGEGTLPMGTVMSPDSRELFVTTGRGNSVVVIDTAKEAVVATIPVGTRAWGIAISPDGKKIYTANGASDDISVVDVAARKELKRIKAGSGPWGIAVVPATP